MVVSTGHPLSEFLPLPLTVPARKALWGDAVRQGQRGPQWERRELRERLSLSSKWFLCTREHDLLGAVKALLVYANWGKKW